MIVKRPPKIIACDFDGTLVMDAYPNIGLSITETINALQIERLRGSKFILWTCRSGEKLDEAIAWCIENDMPPDAVNENLPGIVDVFGIDSRKVFANEYWDDRAIPMGQVRKRP